MRPRKVTLDESIAALARETGASPSFVDKVRALFLGRGIDLEDSSEPYAAALDEAFRRHAEMRHQLDEARGSLARLHADLAGLGEAFSGQLAKLRAVREALERAGGLRRASAPAEVDDRRLSPGDTDRTEVPGPKELQ